MMFLPFLLAMSHSNAEAIYLGTYTSPNGSKGIYRTELNPQTGELSAPTLAAESPNPSFVALHPNGKFLYAVNERAEGQISAFSVKGDGSLAALNQVPSLGADPCHLSLTPDGKHLFAANYSGGSLSGYGIAADGRLVEPAQHFQATGSGPNKSRQETPHLHAVAPTSDGKYIYACDLGTDQVYVFSGSVASANLKGNGSVPAGGGPRHFVVSKDGHYLFANSEMTNAVTSFRRNPESGQLTAQQTLSSLPAGFTGYSSSAEVILHPTGKWLYVSNRGHDSVAVFEIAQDGTLKLSEVVSTVAQPRGMDVDPSGKWLVVASQAGDKVVSLAIDPATGHLMPTGHSIQVSKPVCVVFTGR